MAELKERPKHTGHGGKRPGAGRKPKGYVAPSTLGEVDRISALASEPPEEIDTEARRYAGDLVRESVKILMFGTSDAAKIAVAKEILDRGWGKPAVEIGGDAAMLPFMMAPSIQASLSATAELRAECRKYGKLALEVLHGIATRGQTESSRASAQKALYDRGFGTVGKARLPDEQRERPLGKKEEAARAAETAATGRYATPPPPPRTRAEIVQ